jgi:hypothetical protein
MTQHYQLNNMRYIKRYIVGNNDPKNLKTEQAIEEEMNLVNTALNLAGSSKGTIIGVEKSFAIYNHGEHQIVMQYFVYHLGFERKPLGW